MNITPTNGLFQPTATSGATRTSGTSGTSAASLQDQFLKLLVVQLQNQDPLNPTSQADFTGQLSQLSTLQSLQQLNSNFETMFKLQQLTQGANLIGKQVQFEQKGVSGLQQGLVSAVNINSGVVQLQVGNQAVSLDQIRSVQAAP